MKTRQKPQIEPLKDIQFLKIQYIFFSKIRFVVQQFLFQIILQRALREMQILIFCDFYI